MINRNRRRNVGQIAGGRRDCRLVLINVWTNYIEDSIIGLLVVIVNKLFITDSLTHLLRRRRGSRAWLVR